jgi:hypothetical protein
LDAIKKAEESGSIASALGTEIQQLRTKSSNLEQAVSLLFLLSSSPEIPRLNLDTANLISRIPNPMHSCLQLKAAVERAAEAEASFETIVENSKRESEIRMSLSADVQASKEVRRTRD